MAEVVLFHHAHGLTPGCLAFAEELRSAGHTVHAPDLYEGRTFASLDEGVAYADDNGGVPGFVERARPLVESLPAEVVYAGFSLGGGVAQVLTQTRPGALGALLFHSCFPPELVGVPWPDGVPLEIHTAEDDEWVELDEAREIVRTTDRAELFVYPGDAHLFADESLPDYDEGAASLLKQRALRFLDAVGR